MTKPFHLGRTAQSALTATRLAEAGLTSSPDALEHDVGFLRAVSPQRHVDVKSDAQFGKVWRILTSGINVKLYPMCFGTHRILDAMIDVCRDNKIAPDDDQRRRCRSLAMNSVKILRNPGRRRARGEIQRRIRRSRPPPLPAAARSEEVSNDFVRRPDVQDFFGKVRIHALTEKDPEEPTRSPFDRVRLTLRDGRKVASEECAIRAAISGVASSATCCGRNFPTARRRVVHACPRPRIVRDAAGSAAADGSR